MSYYVPVIIAFIVVSLINSYLDFRTLHISAILNYAGLLVCFLLVLFIKPSALLYHLAGGGLLFLIFFIVRLLTHKGLGWGDIHYSLLCGFVSALKGFIFCALLSSFAGILYFLFLRFVLKKKNAFKSKIPFIPMMFIGTIAGLPLSDYMMSLL